MMGGWKTWAAAIGAILGGIVLIVNGLAADPMDFSHFAEAWAMIIAGLGMIGIGHKIEKSMNKNG